MSTPFDTPITEAEVYRVKTAPVSTASPASVSYCRDLMTEKAVKAGHVADEARVNIDAWLARATQREVSDSIDRLKGEGFTGRRSVIEAAGRPAAPAPVEIEDGMYRLDGVIFKVQHAVHGSGKQYAKRAEITAHGDGDFDVEFIYAPGVVSRLTPAHRMSYDEAREFGALYGTCCRCGKTLTDELSIHLGIGPVCGGREFGEPFKALLRQAKADIAAAASR